MPHMLTKPWTEEKRKEVVTGFNAGEPNGTGVNAASSEMHSPYAEISRTKRRCLLTTARYRLRAEAIAGIP